MKQRIEKLVEEVQGIQKELATAVNNANNLQSQLTENKLVKDELDHLEEDAKIYKLVGPVLIPQKPEEAKTTVNTRIEYIAKEVKNSKEQAQKIEKKQQERRVTLLTEQQKFQALVQQVSAQKQ